MIVAATRNAARAMGRAGEVGTVEVGALGDLVVLGESPLEDVRGTRTVVAVVKGGRVVYRRP